jgi:hypothetical protein
MKYLLAIINDESQARPDPTPEQMQEMMEPWNALNRELLDAGAFVAGEGLQPSASATTVRFGESDQTVTDGPFAETKEQLGGFYLIECPNLDEALAWAKKVPTQPGNAVEVWPAMDFSQFEYEDPYQAAAKA